LMKRLCDMTLVEVAREFRVKSYGNRLVDTALRHVGDFGLKLGNVLL